MADSSQDDTMSDVENLMWRVEADPALSATFANVTILDRAPDVDLLRSTMRRAAHVIPRLHQRVHTTPGNLSPPTWAADPDFDLDFHVRRISLPGPGTERQLFDFATLLIADPFDRTRPLWQFVVVEDLPNGRAALVEKLHHTITDGERGIQLSLEFLDFERHPPPRPDLPDEPEINTEDQTTDADMLAADAVRDVLAGGLRIPLGIARQVRELLADPTQIPAASASANETLGEIVAQLGDIDQARSPLWTKRSVRRRFDVATTPLQPVLDSAKRLGGTLNIAFLTIATEAASRYHAELGAPVDELRASMAVSTRTTDSGANAFSLIRFLVPTGDLSIEDRFLAIRESCERARAQTSKNSLQSLAALGSTLPTPVLLRLARQQAHTVDFATSNVRGSPVAMYVAGAQVLHNYPIGPLSGVAFNTTLLSYEGNIDLGINTDSAAVTEPDLLTKSVATAARDFARLAR